MSRLSSASSKSGKDKHITNGHQQKNVETSSSDDDEDEPIRVPLQLKIEFVNSIMFRQWPLAKKLCQFMLMYEPNHPDAKQYEPLIDYMLTKEESSSSSDDTSDDDDEDGDESSGSSSSSSSSDEEDKPNDTVEPEAPKPVNAALSIKCPHHK